VKLLLDENLSFRLVGSLADAYPSSAHVRDLGLLGAPDEAIWRHAAEHGFVLTSKDADFYQRSVAYGSPPKVIWLRIGNAPTAAIAALLRERYVTIRRFCEDEESSFLPLSPA
jgi:predicted nuclease of predicted toxin-antitoxin system